LGDPLFTALTERLGCRLPVIQTAMGWVATPGLVARPAMPERSAFLAGAVMKPGRNGARKLPGCAI
jgi:NAD(P)H-dependent flavin oxidoreductase YrpB (nitropropane dioxygenase family)